MNIPRSSTTSGVGFTQESRNWRGYAITDQDRDFYRDINYQGAEQCYSAGDEINDLGAQRKSISSIRVYGRGTVTVYENTAFRGHSAQFTSDVSDLGQRMMAGNTAWSDHIDSLESRAFPEL